MIPRNTDNRVSRNTMSQSLLGIQCLCPGELKQTDRFGSGSFSARTMSRQFGCIKWVGSGTDNKLDIGMTSLNE